MLDLNSLPAPAGHHHSRKGEPTWEMAFFFPLQGNWTEADYLRLDTNRLVELSDGCLEFLPMPTTAHQRLVSFLHHSLGSFVSSRAAGAVLFAPLPIRVGHGKYREPDVVYLLPMHTPDVRRQPEGAALVMEVVIGEGEDRRRDLVTKRGDYAAGGISEYWIVDPQTQRITILALEDKSYRTHGEFGPGAQVTSVLLPGFSVSVDAVFAAGQGGAGS
jgi:Uma2 family endonuclease